MQRDTRTKRSRCCNGLRETIYLLAALLLAGCGGGGANSAGLSQSGAAGGTALTIDGVQRQLAQLPCPPGVPPALWLQLTGELAEQLGRRTAARELVPLPPLDELSVVDDLALSEDPPGTLMLRWRYRNTGDYDQNGEANVSDLTPIGRNFSRTAADAQWKTARVADGDENGEVNVADVTPIGRCFMQTVTDYRVEYKPAGGSYLQYSHVASVQFSHGVPDADGWLRFNFAYVPAASGFYRVVPYYYDQRGIEGLPAFIGISNAAPTAVLTADQQIGASPLVVHFDASASSDPDLDVLRFRWDFEGDGVIDLNSGTNPLVEHTYTELGDYAPRVIVSDPQGAQDSDQLMAYCHEWEMHPLPEIGFAHEIGVVNGAPAFVYLDRFDIDPDENTYLGYARAQVAVPTSSADWLMTDLVPPMYIDPSLEGI